MVDESLSHRIRMMRDARGLTQRQLSDGVGFKDRQTLAAIEAAERRVTPAELVAIAKALDVTVEQLTDPYRLVGGEGRFSFRAKGVEAGVLDAFEQRAGRWIATYRQLGKEQGAAPKRLAHKLDLSPRASFEDAQASAEEIVEGWTLGDRPAELLPEAVHGQLGALVLFVDAPQGISGAASVVPGLPAILVNRQEPRGRRSYDLAHELFHLLTWDVMPPDRVDPWDLRPTKGNRVEQLAESFAAALLMPATMTAQRWEERSGEIHDWLNCTASDLGVSAVALKWRLKNLGLLGKGDLLAINDGRLVANGDPESAHDRPPLFSRSFAERIHAAVEEGRLSLRRTAELLDVALPDLAGVFEAYDLSLSYEV